jgi:hypothetical protein
MQSALRVPPLAHRHAWCARTATVARSQKGLNMLTTRCLPLIALLCLLGCPTKDATPTVDAGRDLAASSDTSSSVDAPADGAAVTGQTKPLAEGCASNDECASGFCADGVCCDSACDQSCYSCHLTGSYGSCLPQLVGDDPTATPACDGAKTCGVNSDFVTSGSLSACNLKNLQKCSANTECASNHCATYYTDADGDGYGSSSALRLCNNSGAAAPRGFSTVSGDCCDSDAFANPAVTFATWFDYADACGSFDYNCDGVLEQQYSPSKPVACGAALFLDTLMGCH